MQTVLCLFSVFRKHCHQKHSHFSPMQDDIFSSLTVPGASWALLGQTAQLNAMEVHTTRAHTMEYAKLMVPASASTGLERVIALVVSPCLSYTCACMYSCRELVRVVTMCFSYLCTYVFKAAVLPLLQPTLVCM
jgi:hypothetical protein